MQTRTLKFIVDDHCMLKPDPNCDFSGLIPGTKGYLQAEFAFPKQWDGFVKAVEFFSIMGKAYTPQPLENGKTCTIPEEALARRIFQVRVKGKKGPYTLLTDKAKVYQDGGES